MRKKLEEMRSMLPQGENDEKLTKLQVVLGSIEYIRDLKSMVDGTFRCSASSGEESKCGSPSVGLSEMQRSPIANSGSVSSSILSYQLSGKPVDVPPQLDHALSDDVFVHESPMTEMYKYMFAESKPFAVHEPHYGFYHISQESELDTYFDQLISGTHPSLLGHQFRAMPDELGCCPRTFASMPGTVNYPTGFLDVLPQCTNAFGP